MIIENDKEHQVMVDLLSELMIRTPASRAVGIVAKVIEEYEHRNWPLPEPTPEEAIKFRSDENPKTTPGLTRWALAEHQGSAAERKVIDRLWLTPAQATQFNRDQHATNRRLYPSEWFPE